MSNDEVKEFIDPSIQLVDELSKNRKGLYDMLSKVSSFRESVDGLLPEKVSFRNKDIFAERIRTMTEVFKVELSIRGQIDKSIGDELKLRDRIDITAEDIKSSDIKAFAGYLRRSPELKNLILNGEMAENGETEEKN